MKATKRARLKSLGEHLSDFLPSEGTRTLENFCVAFHLSLLLTAASTRANGTPKDFCSPPTVDGTLRMGKTHDRIWICEGPCMRCLGKTGYDVKGSEREGWCEGLDRRDFTS
jgi:hypothetical protein